MSKILAVDTANDNLSVCIFSDGNVLSLISESDKKLQAERLVPIIEKTLLEAKLNYNDIDVFSACLGPGSFTGIRIGLSAVRAIAYSLNKNFSGVTSLEAMAQNYKSPCNVLLNANKNEAYFQNFVIDKNSESELINLDDLKRYADKLPDQPFITDKIEIIKKLEELQIRHHSEIIQYNAQDIAEFLSRSKIELNRKSPIYIRKPDAKVGKRSIYSINN